VIAAGVMQAADGNERVARGARDDCPQRFERAADHCGGGLEHTGIGGGVTAIEHAATAARQLCNAIDIARRVKVLELCARGLPRRDERQALECGRTFGLGHEGAVAVRAERVPVRKSIARELRSRDQCG